MTKGSLRAFTLIELSIVLVIIGLIVGGVLVGQSLIGAAAVRAQITQIEKFNTAANTFFGKYGYLPGDIPAAPAARFGFAARGQFVGEGDGNGIIMGSVQDTIYGAAPNGSGEGEPVLFWMDLSSANLIDGAFTSGQCCNATYITSTTWPITISQMIPAAKIGQSNFIDVYNLNNINYFSLANVSLLGYGVASTPALTVQQAYAIDKKIDDGLPMSGRVIALYNNNSGSGYVWAGGSDTGGAPYTTASPGSSTTCFDNSYAGGATATQQYSLSQNNGNGVNCALSFRMQAGD